MPGKDFSVNEYINIYIYIIMSHTNEKGMVVGKRYMLTYKTEKLTQITILKYSAFTDKDTDIYHIEHLLNTKTGELKENFEFEKRTGWIYFLNIIDMEEIDLEYSKLKLTFAKGLKDENSLLYSLSYDFIESIVEKFEELYFETCLKIYFETCLKIYDRFTQIAGEYVQLNQNYFKGGGKKRKSKKRRRKSKKKNKSKTRRRRR